MTSRAGQPQGGRQDRTGPAFATVAPGGCSARLWTSAGEPAGSVAIPAAWGQDVEPVIRDSYPELDAIVRLTEPSPGPMFDPTNTGQEERCRKFLG